MSRPEFPRFRHYNAMVETKIIEATQDLERGFNWGKFCVARFTDEWQRRSGVDTHSRTPLLRARGWGPDHLWVLDLETGEGGFFRPGGKVSADLNKTRIRVCPLFEPFLAWLYKQDLTDLAALPNVVELPDAPPAMQSYRRSGTVDSPP